MTILSKILDGYIGTAPLCVMVPEGWTGSISVTIPVVNGLPSAPQIVKHEAWNGRDDPPVSAVRLGGVRPDSERDY